jgi:hypothetical protein
MCVVLLCLCQAVVPFPFQVVPNTNGLFQSIGLDSLAGRPTTHTCMYILLCDTAGGKGNRDTAID